MPGRNLARAPVAMIVRGVSSVTLPDLLATSILPRPVSVAVPMIWVTPYFLNRCSTPLDSFSATPRLRLMILSQSKVISPLMMTP